jgi:hypothetical protein
MSRGISTTVNVGKIARCLKSEGLDFVIRYYSAGGWKRMDLPEAVALSAAGLQLVSVYEDGPRKGQQNGYFTARRGANHGRNAYQYASDVIHQPWGSTIYFAIDWDYTKKADISSIIDYFHAVQASMVQESEGQPNYKVGVYGSGMICRTIKDEHRLAAHSWLAGSPGWTEFEEYKRSRSAEIVQIFRDEQICGIKSDRSGTADYEYNEANDEYGAFTLPTRQLPRRLLALAIEGDLGTIV